MKKSELSIRRIAKAHNAKSVTRTPGGHFKIIRADGAPIYVPSTPSDRRSGRNLRAALRRFK